LPIAEMEGHALAQVQRPLGHVGVRFPFLRQARDERAGLGIQVQQGLQVGIILELIGPTDDPEAVGLVDPGRGKDDALYLRLGWQHGESHEQCQHQGYHQGHRGLRPCVLFHCALLLVWPIMCIKAVMSGTFSRSSSIAIARSASCCERTRPTQSQTLAICSSRFIGFAAEPVKPRHSALTVVPSVNRAVTVTTPGACSMGSTRIFRSVSSMSGANRRWSVKLSITTVPSSSATAAQYSALNLPSSPLCGTGPA